MNPNTLHIEHSRSTKTKLLAMRKSARTRGGFRHTGLVQTAHASTDIAIAASGIILDFTSLGILYTQMPFHLGICAGLIAFDFLGAGLKARWSW